MADMPAGTPAVTDHRPTPRGVLPRGTQTWLMVGVAVVILGIIVLTGRPTPAPRGGTATFAPVAPSPDRLRDYQDRLRVLDERARQQPVSSPTAVVRPERASPAEPRRETPPDALEQEQKRREYNSLFATNVVLSRRAPADRLATVGDVKPNASSRSTLDAAPTPPSLDQVAEAVVRASTRHGQGSLPGIPTAEPPPAVAPVTADAASRIRPATGPVRSDGARHRLIEGTLIDTVLTNRLDGAVAAPVNCLVTNPVYSHDGRFVLIPAGARVLGETKAVQAFGETRLAVAFTRLVLPDGRTYPLDRFMGLNEIGDAGLRDRVNQHYRSTFGASAAIGLIAGFAQWLGPAAFGRNAGTVVIAGSAAESTGQATTQTMNRFLNRLPTITIREGHRVKVYLTNDMELPAYGAPTEPGALVANGREREPS